MVRKHYILMMTLFLAIFSLAITANMALAEETESPEATENAVEDEQAIPDEPEPAPEPEQEADNSPQATETNEGTQPASTRHTRSHRVSGGLTMSENPGLLLGASIGPGLQRFSRETNNGTIVDDYPAFLLSVMVDYGWQLGPGNLGLQVHGNLMIPDFYMGLGFIPRYMAEFILKEYLISIAPWIGWNFQFGGFAMDGPGDVDTEFRFHFNSGISLGVNMQFLENFYGTMQFDLNFIGTDASYWGTDRNYTNYLFKFGVAYRLM